MKELLFKILYSILFLPLAVIRILFKSYKNPKYLVRLPERFAIFKAFDQKIDIWLHTVSVGEFLAAKTLIAEILAHNPTVKLLLTTTTPTGSELVVKYINDFGQSNIKHLYYPYDATFICRKFLKKTNPTQVLFFETEIWPKMFAAIKAQGIKLYIINARLSEKSYMGYRHIKKIINQAINKVDFIAAQGADDRQRFIGLGYKQENIEVFGNIKYNLKLPQDLATVSMVYKNAFGKNRPVVIAASTHAGEEEIILKIFNNLKKQFKDLLLIIAPRHPERFNGVYELCVNDHLQVIKYTDLSSNLNSEQYAKTEVLLLNTLGKLLYFYNMADFAFIGGSFADIGGHNPLEPAVLQVPAIIGPHYYNFTEIIKDLESSNGILIANTVEDLENTMVGLLANTALCKKIGLAASESLKKHQGVLAKYLQLIECN